MSAKKVFLRDPSVVCIVYLYTYIILKYHRIVAVTLSGFKKNPRPRDFKNARRETYLRAFYCVYVCVTKENFSGAFH